METSIKPVEDVDDDKKSVVSRASCYSSAGNRIKGIEPKKTKTVEEL